MMIIITILVVIAHIIYIEPQHHRMVLVNRVVAVHWVAPDEVPEAKEEFDIVTLAKPHDVLATPLD